MTFIDKASPNFEARTGDIRFIVLHYTGMPTLDDALTRLTDTSTKVSAHYLIAEDGCLFRLVDEKNRAWHAGQSYWQGLTDLNSASIGIELENPGHEFGYKPFSQKQLDTLVSLTRDIIDRHKLDPKKALLAHSDIAPSRKNDPGELFPWDFLAKNGIGFWPTATSLIKPLAPEDAHKILMKIGYDPNVAFSTLLTAFQRRWMLKVCGDLNQETGSMLLKVSSFFN